MECLVEVLCSSAFRFPISVYFTPTSDKEVNFNVIINVKRKTLPLTLNVKAEGYSMNCLVLCGDSMGHKIELDHNSINAINFGDVSTFRYLIHAYPEESL